MAVRRTRGHVCPAAENWSAGHTWAEETPGGADAQGCRSWTTRAWKAQINFHLTPPTLKLLRPHPIERKHILQLNPGHRHSSLNVTEKVSVHRTAFYSCKKSCISYSIPNYSKMLISHAKWISQYYWVVTQNLYLSASSHRIPVGGF